MLAPQRINPETLRGWLENPGDAPAVVDVRDDDRIGGHIRGSIHVPSAAFLNQLPSLREQVADSKKVVFYCQFSQQRGPTCAKRYLLDRQKAEAHSEDASDIEQAVFVLDGGFSNWVYSFRGKDEFTENLAEDLYM